MKTPAFCRLALAVIAASGGQTRADEVLHEETIPNITVVGIRGQQSNLESLNIKERRFGPAVDGADLLRQVNGLSLGRFGGRGLEPTLRGQSETRINVLLDGSYLHGGCPNRMDPPTAFAAVNSFERVVVLKGVQTLRYGGGGSGGTLLFERDNEPREQGISGKFSAGTTSNGLRGDLALDTAWSQDDLYFRFNGQRRSADNYQDGDGGTVRSAWEERSAYLVAGMRLRTSDRLELAYETTRTDDSLYPGAGMDAPMDQSEQWRLKYQGGDVGPLSSLSLDLYQSDVDHLMDNYSERPLMMPVALRVPSSSTTAGARLVGEWDGAGLGYWTFGLDHQYNRRQATRFMGTSVDSVNTVNAYMWPDTRLSQSGAFAELRYSLGSSTTLRTGLRYDRVRADARDVDLNPPSPMLEGPNALYERYYGIRQESPAKEDNTSGLLRLERVAGHWTFFAGASQTRRTADASERFLAAANAAPMMRWIGNPGLAPETHRQIDAGAVWSRDGQRIDLVLFRDDVSDYILRDRAHGQDGISQSDNASIYRNVDARLQGIEASWDWEFADRWSARADLAYVHAQNTDDDRPIAQTPPLNGTVSLSYTASDWDLGTSLRWSDEQTRVDSNAMVGSGIDAGETPGWAVLNLYARLALGAGGELRAGVDNIFDRTYAEHLNRGNRDPFYPEPLRVNEPGRVVWARYEYRF